MNLTLYIYGYGIVYHLVDQKQYSTVSYCRVCNNKDRK
jgi:hypothetical protein